MRNPYTCLSAVALAIVFGVIPPITDRSGVLGRDPTVVYARDLTKPEPVAGIKNFTLSP